jgi:RecA-family ATPase
MIPVIPSSELVEASSIVPAPFDRDAIHQHFTYLHHAAVRAEVPDGKVCLAVYGEDPDTRETFAWARHFGVGDVDAMTAAAMEFDGVPHRNIYAPYVVFKPETPDGTRLETDIAFVLALVNDKDADKGTAAPSPLPADYIIESSTGNFQEAMWLDKPLTPAEAKPLAQALKNATGADGANDIGHVWRVSGASNWPNHAKVHDPKGRRCSRRDRAPQAVRVNKEWKTWTTVETLRNALKDHMEAPKAPRVERTDKVREPREGATSDKAGLDYYEFADTKAFYQWMAANKIIKDDEDWWQSGAAAKLAHGERGLELWQIVATDKGALSPASLKRWRSFDTEPTADSVTIRSFMDRAHAAEPRWTGRLRQTLAAMFPDVQAQVNGTYVPREQAPPLASEQPIAAELLDQLRRPLECEYESDETPDVLRSRRINAASLEGKPVPVREWLIRDLIPAKNVTLLYGDGGTGKSLLALQAAAAVVLGRPFFGHLVATRGRVEFITAEDSLDEMHRRLDDIARSQSVPLSGLDGLHLTSLAEADALLAVPQDNRGGALAETALYNELSVLLAESSPAVLFLDTLADIYGGNEVVRAQARQFIGMLRRLALQHGCTIVVLTHPSLAGMDRGTSGSTAWSNSVRSRLYLSRVHEGDGTELDEDLRVLRVAKSNYGRVGDETQLRWRAGVFVTVHMAGDPLLANAKAEKVFLDLLTKYTDQGQSVGRSHGANFAPKVFEPEARLLGVNKRAMTLAMQRLLDTKRIWIKVDGPTSRRTRQLVVSTNNSSASIDDSTSISTVQTQIKT